MSFPGQKPFLQTKQGISIHRKSSGLDFPPHLHNAVELVLMCSGHSTVLYEGRRIPLSEGDLFLAFPEQIHGYEDSRDNDSIVLIIPLHPYLNEFRETLERKLPACPVLRKEEWEHTKVGQLLEMAAEEHPKERKRTAPGYATLIMAKLLPLLTLQEAPFGNAGALQSVLRYLNRNYTRPLTRPELAKAVGYNESYLSHLFADTLHTTLTDYITALRMDDATYLLSNTDLNVAQIAEELGFGSQRSFNRMFLKHTQMTPSAYRAASRLAGGESL